MLYKDWQQCIFLAQPFLGRRASRYAAFCSNFCTCSFYNIALFERSSCCYSVFQLNRPTVWVENSKIDFQDGSYCSHFGFPIGMILAIFHLHILSNLLLRCKFQLNSPCGLREAVQNRFSRWRLWWPSWISNHDFSSFRSCCYRASFS